MLLQLKDLILIKSLLNKFFASEQLTGDNLFQSLINFSLFFKITSKAGVRLMLFQHKLQSLVGLKLYRVKS